MLRRNSHTIVRPSIDTAKAGVTIGSPLSFRTNDLKLTELKGLLATIEVRQQTAKLTNDLRISRAVATDLASVRLTLHRSRHTIGSIKAKFGGSLAVYEQTTKNRGIILVVKQNVKWFLHQQSLEGKCLLPQTVTTFASMKVEKRKPIAGPLLSYLDRP